MTRFEPLILNLRNGAILATLSALPILVGFGWSLLWGEMRGWTPGTSTALILAWLAATAVVAGLSLAIPGGKNSHSWTYPCSRCKRPVYLFQYHCTHCRTRFAPPPEAFVFRNALLLGIAVFYATFALGAFLLRS